MRPERVLQGLWCPRRLVAHGHRSPFIAWRGEHEASPRYAPIAAPLLRGRRCTLFLLCALAAHAALTGLGMPVWSCPMAHTLGIPCPGCGLSRAAVTLLQGDWQLALQLHLFAPVALLGFALAAVLSLLPEHHRRNALRLVERAEARTGIVRLILLGLFAYWGVRLLRASPEVIALVGGG